jgi:hypothetical protein
LRGVIAGNGRIGTYPVFVANMVFSATAATYVAIAGGSGAFLGAVVGQVIQAFRDRRLRKIEEERRAEDRRAELDRERRDHQRAAYVELMGICAQLSAQAEELVDVAGTLSQTEGDRSKMNAAFSEEWQPAIHAFDRAFDSLRTLVTAYGSSEINEATSLLPVIRPRVYKTMSGPKFMTRLIQVRDGHLERQSAVSKEDQYALEDYLADTVEIYQGVLEWIIGQARFELKIDSIAPPPTGFPLDPTAVVAAASRRGQRT